MDGFKNSTKTKYMCGGPVKKATGGPVKMREGGTFNERGKRATMAEIAAEDRRMAGRPVEGASSRPTDASGRRASDAELGMTSPAKKAVGPSSVAVSKVLAAMTKKGVPAYSGKPVIRRKTGGLAAMPGGKC
jgi:hypothetical protein